MKTFLNTFAQNFFLIYNIVTSTGVCLGLAAIAAALYSIDPFLGVLATIFLFSLFLTVLEHLDIINSQKR